MPPPHPPTWMVLLVLMLATLAFTSLGTTSPRYIRQHAMYLPVVWGGWVGKEGVEVGAPGEGQRQAHAGSRRETMQGEGNMWVHGGGGKRQTYVRRGTGGRTHPWPQHLRGASGRYLHVGARGAREGWGKVGCAGVMETGRCMEGDEEVSAWRIGGRGCLHEVEAGLGCSGVAVLVPQIGRVLVVNNMGQARVRRPMSAFSSIPQTV